MQDLNVRKLKAHMMFQIRPLNKFGIFWLQYREAAFLKTSPESLPQRKIPLQSTFLWLILMFLLVTVADLAN